MTTIAREANPKAQGSTRRPRVRKTGTEDCQEQNFRFFRLTCMNLETLSDAL